MFRQIQEKLKTFEPRFEMSVFYGKDKNSDMSSTFSAYEVRQEVLFRMMLEETFTTPFPQLDENTPCHVPREIFIGEAESYFSHESKDLDSLKEFIRNFNLKTKSMDILRLLDEYEDTLKVHFDTLVPHQVSFKEFWTRFFYRCNEAQVERTLQFKRRDEVPNLSLNVVKDFREGIKSITQLRNSSQEFKIDETLFSTPLTTESSTEEERKNVEAFLKDFDWIEKTKEIATILEEYPDTIGSIHDKLVPFEVRYKDFWERYFYNCHIGRLDLCNIQDKKVSHSDPVVAPFNSVKNYVKRSTMTVINTPIIAATSTAGIVSRKAAELMEVNKPLYDTTDNDKEPVLQAQIFSSTRSIEAVESTLPCLIGDPQHSSDCYNSKDMSEDYDGGYDDDLSIRYNDDLSVLSVDSTDEWGEDIHETITEQFLPKDWSSDMKSQILDSGNNSIKRSLSHEKISNIREPEFTTTNVKIGVANSPTCVMKIVCDADPNAFEDPYNSNFEQ